MSGHGPRNQPQWRHHHWGHAVGAVTPLRHRVQFLPGHSHADGSGCVLGVARAWALHAGDIPMFAVGLLVSFASALLCIRWLIRYVATHDFRWFAWYRIAFGAVVLLTSWGGWVQWKA